MSDSGPSSRNQDTGKGPQTRKRPIRTAGGGGLPIWPAKSHIGIKRQKGRLP